VAKSPRITRRSFADYLLGTGLVALAGTVLYPLARYLIPPKVKEVAAGSVVAAKVGDLQPNSGKVFLFGSKPAILIHTGQGTYKAFTAVWCACHDGHYDTISGQVLAGPPPRPLAEFGVTVKGNDIVVTRTA